VKPHAACLFCAQVNRYAGAEAGGAGSSGPPSLLVKGLEVERLVHTPFVRAVCRGVLEEALVRGSVGGALAVCRGEIQRLLAGDVSLGDLVLSRGECQVRILRFCLLSGPRRCYQEALGVIKGRWTSGQGAQWGRGGQARGGAPPPLGGEPQRYGGGGVQWKAMFQNAEVMARLGMGSLVGAWFCYLVPGTYLVPCTW